MRFVRHLILGALAIILLLVGALAFALYDPLSGGSGFLETDQLITAPPGAQSRTSWSELSVTQTDPRWLASLALRYQPTLVVSALDRFWPVSLASVLGARWHGHASCLYAKDRCTVRSPTLQDLSGRGARGDFLRYPSPADDVRDSFLSVAAYLGTPATVLTLWPLRLAAVDPFASAQVYFHYLARTARHSYPGLPAGLVSLEYWFFYPLNYFPLVRIPLEALSDPIGSTLGNTDYHQGDIEHVAVLLDPKSLRPRYLWMARHADEGQAYPWHSPAVQWTREHATVYAALGSHASYADCGIQRRSRTYFFINDYVPCIPHETYGFTAAATRLVDLDHTAWACWPGHLGDAGPRLARGLVGLTPYETDGPVSPLLQSENFRTTCHVTPGTPKPKPQL